MNLFAAQINNWDEWSAACQNIGAWQPLIQHIFEQRNLAFSEITKLERATNAVYRVGDYVVKIFIPAGTFDGEFVADFNLELHGMRFAAAQGVPSPKLIAFGVLEDKYHFRYMIMEYIHGRLLGNVISDLSYEEKVIVGQKLRQITDRLNVQCSNFSPINMLENARKHPYWEEDGFPPSFQAERETYLGSVSINEDDNVYCHGDLHGNNLLVDGEMNLYVLDFADAMYAPAEYEHVYIASSLFGFEQSYMRGYFGDYSVNEIVDWCMAWLPIHDHGHAAIQDFWKADEITSFSVLRERLYELIEAKAKFSRNNS